MKSDRRAPAREAGGADRRVEVGPRRFEQVLGLRQFLDRLQVHPEPGGRARREDAGRLFDNTAGSARVPVFPAGSQLVDSGLERLALVRKEQGGAGPADERVLVQLDTIDPAISL